MGHFDDDCIGFVGVLYCSFTFMNTLWDNLLLYCIISYKQKKPTRLSLELFVRILHRCFSATEQTTTPSDSSSRWRLAGGTQTPRGARWEGRAGRGAGVGRTRDGSRIRFRRSRELLLQASPFLCRPSPSSIVPTFTQILLIFLWAASTRSVM